MCVCIYLYMTFSFFKKQFYRYFHTGSCSSKNNFDDFYKLLFAYTDKIQFKLTDKYNLNINNSSYSFILTR